MESVPLNDLSERLLKYLENTVPSMGKFILHKQCKDLGIDPENITKENLDDLSHYIARATEMFLGFDKSEELKRVIKWERF